MRETKPIAQYIAPRYIEQKQAIPERGAQVKR
jgi:hypothetical protein